MRLETSLRGRIVAAYVGLSLAVCGCFALVAWFALVEAQKYVIERRLESLAEWQFRRADTTADLPRGLTFHFGAAIPADLAARGPGFHEVKDGSRNRYVLLGERNDGTPYAVVDGIGDLERIEREVFLSMAGAILISALLAALLGRITAGRVIRPVTELADAVQRDTLRAGSPALMQADEIGVLARAFAAHSAEQLRFLERERLFTGDVSHELRTPLTVILGAAEVLAVGLQARPDLLAPVERIQRTATETAARVAALLLLSRAPDRIDAPLQALRPLLVHEVQHCRPFLAGKPVTLRIDAPEEVWVLGRSELIGMVVGNVLRNACQYTEKGEILVSLRRRSVVVDDTGPGIPQAMRGDVFERFVRGAETESQGAGLGLAIAKRIVEHLGWEIELDDLGGCGSRFTLRFPAEPRLTFTPP